MSNNITITVTDNFKAPSVQTYTPFDFKSICEYKDTCYDERLSLLSLNTNYKTMEWYANYLETASIVARHNPDTYATYLLDLGYIPIVYLPSCSAMAAATLLNVLKQADLQFIQIRATSFNQSYVVSDSYDAWVHKLDILQKFNIEPRAVTSAEVVRRLYGS